MELLFCWVIIIFGLAFAYVGWCLHRLETKMIGIESRMEATEDRLDNIEVYYSNWNKERSMIVELDEGWYDTYFQGDKHFVTYDGYGNLVISFKEDVLDG